MISAAGTFCYAGIAPETIQDRRKGWPLNEQSESGRADDPEYDRLCDNRLVGIRPTVRIDGRRLMIEAPISERDLAEHGAAALELDSWLINAIRGGDVLTLVRNGNGELGLSLVREGRLVAAAGAVRSTPLGEGLTVREGPEVDTEHIWEPRPDGWMEVSVSGEVRRLRAGEEATIGGYRFSVFRLSEFGFDGTDEMLAISLEDACPHDAVRRSTQLMATGKSLTLFD
jgi:hypothetical protein